MAINSINIICNKNQTKSSSTNVSNGSSVSSQFMKVISGRGKCGKLIKTHSPYLTDEKRQFSMIKEKRTRKPEPNFVSSFPLAARIYKSNSDEVRLAKQTNKTAKSVLTLPNEPLVRPQECTVSDINDSEYINRDDEDRKHKVRKRLSSQNKRRSRRNKEEIEFYDRDARYCSQMNIHLDCSSSDLINNFNGDGKQYPNKDRSEAERSVDPQDVWSVLRNINQFQFRPSPPMSRGNITSPKKKRPLNKKRKHLKDTRFLPVLLLQNHASCVIETCRTEEFAYISNFEVTGKSPNLSQSSSFDRITVINKDGEFGEIYKEFEKKISKTQNFTKDSTNAVTRNRTKNMNARNKKTVKNNSKVKAKADLDSNSLVPFKQMENNTTKINKYIDSCIEIDNNHDKKPLYHKSRASLNVITKTYNSDQFSLSVKAGGEIKEESKINKVNLYRDGNETLCSRYSSSGKADLRNFVSKNINMKQKTKLSKDMTDEPRQEIKGITRIVFNKPQDVISPKRDLGRKPQFVETAANSIIPPTLNPTELKRRIPNMKFPMVILGKDQLSSSSILVESFDAFQFYRLDKQVWPFIVNWYDHKVFSNDKNNSEIANKDENDREIVEYNSVHRSFIDINKTKHIATSDGKSYNNLNNKKKTEIKRKTPCIENNNEQLQQIKKTKPIHQFKDKVLQLLYKKSSVGNMIDDAGDYYVVQGKDNAKKQNHSEISKNLDKLTDIKKKDASTETYNKVNHHQDILKERMTLSSPSAQFRKTTITKYPWGKVKWASDFIDNIIKKVKSGIYYIEENRGFDHKQYADSPAKEASIQTNLSMRILDDYIIEENEFIPKVMTNIQKNPLKIIPGFDDTLQAIEIKTMNVKKITVKHCLTNVMVEFDVAIPTESKCVLNPQKVSSLVPITITNSHTKIFKCKKTILNSALPAELCCLLPKMMQNVIEFSNCKHLALPPTLEEKNNTNLSTITELTPCDHPDSFPLPLISHITISRSRNLTELSKGSFPDTIKNKWINKERVMKFYSSNIADIFTKVEVVFFMPLFNVNLNTTAMFSKQKYSVLPAQKTHSCTALQPYVASKRSLIPTVMSRTFMNIFQKLCLNDIIIHFNASISSVYTDNIKITAYNNPYKIKNNNVQKLLSLSVSNLKMNSLFTDLKPNVMMISNFSSNNSSKSTHIEEYIKPCKIEKSYLHNLGFNNTKNKKKCFIRLYKKCKSTTNISGERTSASLSKIVNIEDFCQVLGSGKLLSRVFEGYTERKILKSIAEMRNWITEISQSQAMLVLLLMNKKDTPNLVRFRPILLQGIAVNRITRASELDMEIEVIERENTNRRSRYEGISYITSSEQTKDSLLEELYWIAKTTASDYQKPFDELSERQLKSLLEKRKKLNPSYLRVMARYVGLGLLKSSRNNN